MRKMLMVESLPSRPPRTARRSCSPRKAFACAAAVAACMWSAGSPLFPPVSADVPSMATPAAAAAAKLRAHQAYGKLPMSFEANEGQAPDGVKFVARGQGYSLALTATEATLALRKPQPAAARGVGRPDTFESRRGQTATLRMRLVGANADAGVAGQDQLPGKSHYFTTSDPAKWRTNIVHYAKVRYQDVYPGVDAVYYGNQQQLEYDFIVAPRTDPSAIRLAFDGADALRVDTNGDLVLRVAGGELRHRKPYAYQDRADGRQEVKARYELRPGNQVAFELATYDTNVPLVIDPVLVYSTYVGGAGFDGANGLALDAAGNAYITGATLSADFPTTAGAADTSASGAANAYIAKLDPTGTTLVYSTFVGGDTQAIGIAVDGDGQAYIAGITGADFPVVNAFQPFNGGHADGFITKLNANGSAVLYSSFIGGGGNDLSLTVAVDGSQNAYIGGVHNSGHSFPITPGAFQQFPPDNACEGGTFDGAVTKVNTNVSGGGSLVYSTHLAGGWVDGVASIAVDSTGHAYAMGSTGSGNFPTTSGAYDETHNSPFVCFDKADVYITKLNPSGTALVYSTFVGGANTDIGSGIAIDSAGNAYLTGVTLSSDFPTTAGAFAPSYSGGNDAFVVKVNAAGNGLTYSTFLGGALAEHARGIAIDGTGSAYVTGQTNSADFPTTGDAVQATLGGGTCAGAPCNDAFVAKLSPAGSALSFSTFIGGSLADSGGGVAVDAAGSIYVAGVTESANFPTTPGAFGVTNSGGADAFVAKIGGVVAVNVPPTLSADQSSVSVSEGSTATNSGSYNDIDSPSVTVSVTEGPGSVTASGGTWNWSYNSTDDLGPTTVTITVDDGQASSSTSFTLTVTNVSPTASISGAPATSAEGTAIALTGSASDPGADSISFSWSVTKNGSPYASGSGAGFSFTPNDNGSYVVTLTATDDDGGSGSDTKTVSVFNVAPAITGVIKLAGKESTVSFTYSDPGSADTFTCIVDWGDGTSSSFAGSGGGCSATHTYDKGGDYSVTVKVVDDDGDSDAETFSWFVTGSGNVPPGQIKPKKNK
jgi:hypothetical protein